jgi:hypothetical protein
MATATATLTSGLTVTHRYDADDLRAVKVKEGKVQYYLHPVQPFDGETDEPQRWNRYAYALSNPLRFEDPDGLDAHDRIKAATTLMNADPPIHYPTKGRPGGLDCSGLVREVFKRDPDNTVVLTGGASNEWDQLNKAAAAGDAEVGTHITDAKPGDAIFWRIGKAITHTGVVLKIEKGTVVVIHASGSTSAVNIRIRVPRKRLDALASPDYAVNVCVYVRGKAASEADVVCGSVDGLISTLQNRTSTLQCELLRR